MRIVSWNTNGKFLNLRKMMNSIGAQVCLIQEPTDTLDMAGGSRRSADLSPIAWTGVRVPGSCAQDNYFFGYSEAIDLRYHLVESDPRDARDAEGFARNYLILKVKDNHEAVRVATFHAPYGLSSEEREYKNRHAVEYLLTLIGSGLKYKRPPKGGAAGTPAQKDADLILADTNVYENTDCATLAWPCVLNSPTGVGRGGGSLDRIFIRPSRFLNYRCGRIYPRGNRNVGSLSSLDRRSGIVEDIVLPDEPEYQDWVKSDHLAIYFDTDAARDAPLELADGSGQKRRRGDTDLQELDHKGRPRPVKKEIVEGLFGLPDARPIRPPKPTGGEGSSSGE